MRQAAEHYDNVVNDKTRLEAQVKNLKEEVMGLEKKVSHNEIKREFEYCRQCRKQRVIAEALGEVAKKVREMRGLKPDDVHLYVPRIPMWHSCPSGVDFWRGELEIVQDAQTELIKEIKELENMGTRDENSGQYDQLRAEIEALKLRIDAAGL